MSSFRTPRSHTDRLRNRIADGDIGRVADEALRVMDSSRGTWGGGWAQVLDQLREATALLEIHGTRAVLGWRNAAGKPVKTVPAAVKRDHPDELKDLKTAVKDIDKMLSAQSERLDRQFLARRTWPYATWRERYLDHPARPAARSRPRGPTSAATWVSASTTRPRA